MDHLRNLPDKIEAVTVELPEGIAGGLTKPAQYQFTYLPDATPVSKTMPIKAEPYNSGVLHPIFEMNLPEGFIRRYLSDLLIRYTKIDDLLFLALQGKNGIGRLSYKSVIEREEVETDSLEEILAWSGEGLFQSLLRRHVFNGTLSGVQPKVLLNAGEERSSLVSPQYIVKTGGPEFPRLALNEYLCLSFAREAGIAVPDVWLSDNQELLVLKRFDQRNGLQLGMEDYCVLMGKQGGDRYRSSYESGAKVAGPLYRVGPEGLIEYYRYVVFSCIVRNGDAHLKNFALLYEHPSEQPWLAPLYDVVCTSLYPDMEDGLALKMNGSKEFPTREGLVKFGIGIGLKDPDSIIEQLGDLVSDSLKKSDFKTEYPEFFDAVSNSLDHSMALSSSAGYRSSAKRKKPRKLDSYLKK
ncbi:hypothetical protein BTA51_11305 [Hahella sp. CCB-MM4]|uniref:type II toxin-antitoxin system HipA family toxin n=1 Tax=Hahella sp. (strain CCB-MM4) TaxID=1926491 RepID=UPI000B9B4EAC|nr:type II toxin-antitoxin system HipA family toxin [Hahella sp. CCB-MM4]OZG73078.1 hypothetical protein BTA51_11305 [Hahella sp. CCB-MM4]